MTQRLRERFTGRRSDAGDQTRGTMNRASLRAGGLQGSKHTTYFKDGQALGRPRGKFLGPGRRPSILVSNAPDWGLRMFTRIGRQTARSRRTIRRMRAAGEEVI